MPDDQVPMILSAQLGRMGFRGLNPFMIPAVQELFKGGELKNLFDDWYREQQQFLERLNNAYVGLTFGSAGKEGPQAEDLQEFYASAFEAFGVVTRFVPYADLKDASKEKVLGGVFND